MLTRKEARKELNLFYTYSFTVVFIIYFSIGLKIYLYINQL